MNISRGKYFFENNQKEIFKNVFQEFFNVDKKNNYIEMNEKEATAKIKKDIMTSIAKKAEENKLSKKWQADLILKILKMNFVEEIQEKILKERRNIKIEMIESERTVRKKLKNKVNECVSISDSIVEISELKSEIIAATKEMKYPSSMLNSLKKLENKRFELIKEDIIKNPENYFNMSNFENIMKIRLEALKKNSMAIDEKTVIVWAAKLSRHSYAEITSEMIECIATNIDIFRGKYKITKSQITGDTKESVKNIRDEEILFPANEVDNKNNEAHETEYNFVWRGKTGNVKERAEIN